MDLGLRGRKAIVCGSSRGLGKACAQALAEAGVAVVLNGRDRERLETAAEEIRRSTGAEVTPVVADIGTQAGQASLLAACPRPDILINNSGGPPFRDFRSLAHQDMVDGLRMNMLTPIELVQKVIDHMTAQRFGRIVNITSITVKMPLAGLDLSSGARAGLTAFLAGVAREVAAHNVTINQLMPGYFGTERLLQSFAATAARTGATEAEAQAQMIAGIPAGRVGSPAEFGQTCAFLCSTHAAFITGQNLLLDGGMHRSAF